ncbi:response regulator [Paenacidovorax monticola]|uniref:Response regulator n=1 Tax=Paenacidovorax monticola TaxID=1926868 RepID=A0A7H0HJY8_9BURK|nr:response regulator [Paenacidovorax monticola]QNP60854.1 response regulator [Paenacidovorax monticola]
MTDGLSGQRFGVLLVDDDEVACEGVMRSLRKNNIHCQVVLAEDGLEALQILREEHPTKAIQDPFLVLLDLNMPRMDGFEFLEAVRADPSLKETVVFVLTTSGREADRSRAYSENVAGYMVKSHVGPQFSLLAGFLEKYGQAVQFP